MMKHGKIIPLQYHNQDPCYEYKSQLLCQEHFPKFLYRQHCLLKYGKRNANLYKVW